MLKKNKSKSTGLSELHFVSSLQLEQSVMLIGNMADEQHVVTLTEINPDEFQFEVDFVSEQSSRISIGGTLQRWNGTETKIDSRRIRRLVPAELSEASKAENKGINKIILWGIFLSIVAASFAYLIGGQVLHIPIFLIAGIVITAVIVNDYQSKSSDERIGVKAHDILFQWLIDVYKTAGDVQSF